MTLLAVGLVVTVLLVVVAVRGVTSTQMKAACGVAALFVALLTTEAALANVGSTGRPNPGHVAPATATEPGLTRPTPIHIP